MQSICIWRNRERLYLAAEELLKSKAQHDWNIERRKQKLTNISRAAFVIGGMGLTAAGALFHAGMDTLLISACLLLVGADCIGVGVQCHNSSMDNEDAHYPMPDWYIQYQKDEKLLDYILKGQGMRIKGLKDDYGRQLPPCEATMAFVDLDNRKMRVYFRTGNGKPGLISTDVDAIMVA